MMAIHIYLYVVKMYVFSIKGFNYWKHYLLPPDTIS